MTDLERVIREYDAAWNRFNNAPPEETAIDAAIYGLNEAELRVGIALGRKSLTGRKLPWHPGGKNAVGGKQVG